MATISSAQYIGSSNGDIFVTYSDASTKFIPQDSGNQDYQTVLNWVALGNTIAASSAETYAQGSMGQYYYSTGGSSPGWADEPLDRRNWIINGRFDIWQRNVTFSATGYTSDRWLATLGTGAAVTVSRQSHVLGQTAIPGEPQYYCSFSRTTTGSTVSTFEQRIEYVRSMAGQTISASWYAKASSGTPAITWDIVQNFGTGGAPSTAVTTNLVTNEAITTSFVRYSHTITLPSISGKTLGSNGNDYLALRMTLPTAAGVVAINLADIQVEVNPVATAFDVPNRPAYEMLNCQRFHCKTFLHATAETQNCGSLAGAISGTAYGSSSSNPFSTMWDFPVRMRSTPTIVTYCPDAASANWQTQSATTPTAVVVNAGDSAVTIQGTSNVHTGSTYYIHASADAEL